MSSSSVLSRRSSRSSTSVRAQLHAKAKAAKFRADASEELIKKEAEIKILGQKLEAQEAAIEATEFDRIIAEMDEVLETGKEFTSDDRVQQYLSSKERQTQTVTETSLNLNLLGIPSSASAAPNMPSATGTQFVSTSADVHTTSVSAKTSFRSNPVVSKSGDTFATNVHNSLAEYQISTSNGAPAQRDCKKHLSFGLSQNSPLMDKGIGLNLDPPLLPPPATQTRMNETVPPPPFSISTPDSTQLSANNSHMELLVSDCVATNVRIAEMLAKSQLPQLECETFSGDSAEYVRWKRMALVQLSLPMSITERLLRLAKLVTGEAQELVRQYADRFANKPKLAYDKIWEVMDHRFGRASVIANALLQKITGFSNFSLDDSTSLRKFSDLCVSVNLQIESLPGLAVLNYPLYLKPVVSKLPEQFQRKWTDHAYKLISASKTGVRLEIDYPSFAQFSDFLEKLADKACDPNLQIPKANGKFTKMGSGQKPPPGRKDDKKDFGDGDKSDDRSRNPQKTCPVHATLPPSRQHRFSKCKKFQGLSAEEQVDFMKTTAKDHCRSCLELGHGSKCTFQIKCDKSGCTKKHFGFLHDACEILRRFDPAPHCYSGISSDFSDLAICPAQQAFCDNSVDDKLVPVTILHDTGSNISLVTLAICDELGFRKIDVDTVNLNIEVLGGDTLTTQASRYHIPLHNSRGKLLTSITAYGVDRIGSDLPSIDLTAARSILGLQSNSAEIIYPSGTIHLLIGMDNAHVSPCTISRVNGIILAESQLGKLIYGNHYSFSNSSKSMAFTITVKPSDLRMDLVPSLFSTDVLGISCTPKCGGCACKKCPVDGSEFTLQERYEYNQIKDSMTLDNGIITASYPYIRDLSNLPNNYNMALKRLLQTERSLSRDPVRAIKYQVQISEMLSRGVMRKLTPKEENEWTGPVQYLPHNDIEKPGSESTPTRLVFDPSATFRGKSVNQFWGRGPCLLNNPVGILIRFREHPVAYAGDISKMYWCVHTRPQEWHLHRVLWRDMNTSRPPDKYVIVRNSFGSGPAGTVAIAALNFLADRKENELPHAAQVIKHQAFVDDIVDSVPTVDDAAQVTRDIDEILAAGNFKIKGWKIVNSDSAENSAVESLDLAKSESVLGLSWDTNTDEIYFIPRLNFSKKKRKLRVGPDLLPGQIHDRSIVPALTKRSIVSQVNSLYDPLGLLSPFLVELKFAVAKLWRLKEIISWDAEIPDEHDQHWRKLFETFFEIRTLRFPRLLRPSNALEPPILLAFSDSSMISYCTAIYVRWTLSDGEIFGRLVAAKSRIWPIEPEDYLSVARGELQGVLIAKRLAATVVKECRFDFSEVLYVTDSEICMAQIKMNSHDFGVWTGSRVAEIRNGTDTSQFWFVSSENNPCADLCSRGTTNIAYLDKNSTWQCGPDWIYRPRSEWPVKQNLTPAMPIPDLRAESLSRRTLLVSSQPPPDPTSSGHALRPVAAPTVRYVPCEVYKALQQLGESRLDANLRIPEARLEIATFRVDQEDFLASQFDLTRHDNIQLWLATTVRVLNACSWKPGDGCFFKRILEPDVIPASERDRARTFWIKQAQRRLAPAVKKGDHASLTPYYDSEGIIRLNHRSLSTSDYHPILLPSDHPFVRLIVIEVHRRCHDGRVGTANRTRADYHIFKIRRLAASIRAECQLCILKEKRLIKIPMAPLPVKRLIPSFAFEHTSCDLFGPFQIRVEGRITRNKSFDEGKLKAYGVLFSCFSTRAVHISTMQGQDTDAFLCAYRSFVALRGQCRTLFSDNGGQLVAADQELRSLIQAWDLDKLRRYGAENGVEWTFTSPGSPWQNGITEALVRSVKRTLQAVIPAKKLSILELQTVFLEVAELLNERPIGLGSRSFTGNDFDNETNSYLCPNQLLLGRASVRIPAGPFERVPVSHENRFLANQAIVTDWWIRWQSEYVPSLISQSKWFRSDRPCKIGDIVQVKDLNPIRGDWNIGEIIDIKPNSDNVPRNVLLRYKNCQSGVNYKFAPSRTQWRDVKNLSLLLPVEQRSELNPDAPEFNPGH